MNLMDGKLSIIKSFIMITHNNLNKKEFVSIWYEISLKYECFWLFAFIVHSKWLYLFWLCLIVLFSRDYNLHSIIKYCACMKSITNRFIYSTYIINIIKSLSDHDSSLMQVYFVCHLSLSYFSGIWFFSIIYDLLSISLCFSVSSVCKLVIATFIQNLFISLCCEFLWFCTTHYFSVLSLHSLCLVRRLFIYIILAY